MVGDVVQDDLGGTVGAAIVYQDNAVHELGHGIEHLGDLGFFVVAGYNDGYGFVMEHGAEKKE